MPTSAVAAAYCTTAAGQIGTSVQKRFWYSAPAVMPASATTASATAAKLTPPIVRRSQSTSAIPTRPAANPIHCSRATRSPSSAPTRHAVTIGWSPTISAVTPVGRPAATDPNTPPR